MWGLIVIISYLLTQNCLGIYLIDLPLVEPTASKESELQSSEESHESQRRSMKPSYPLIRGEPKPSKPSLRQGEDYSLVDDSKDSDIKDKIATLVQQTLHDTERKIKSIQTVKDEHREQGPYKIGFILSMIKRARDVLNELFNVAVKHRDEWKTLEQLKIFELIVHTNVDTTNLVRQLVENHIQSLNVTGNTGGRQRAVLI